MAVGASLHDSLRDAARAVADVAAGKSLSDVLERAAEAGFDSPRAALLDLTHGTLRAHGRLQSITRELSRKGSSAHPLAEALLWCSIYALDSERYAAHTVVDQAVRACKILGLHQAAGYINGVLRSYLRDKAALEARLQARPDVRWQHPGWWIKTVQDAFPAEWESLLRAGNEKGPMTLRVNRRRVEVAGYMALLADAGIEAHALGGEAVQLARAVPVDRLPGFFEGLVSVQDAGAQHAAPLLDARTGMRVLDACAAPGGKAAHLLERAEIALTAIDVDKRRCAAIERNLERLGLVADVRDADCTLVEQWWDGNPYDRILADVPCSGSGVVRRHPDIKWLRRPSDTRGFAERQSKILDALWRVLAVDGKLLYVTCSVFPEENNAVVDAFCKRTPAARSLPLPGLDGPQLLPGPVNDGFFYALLERSA